jgi:hypothetical protein
VDATQHAVQQRREEGTIGWGEPYLLIAELALQHGELVAQGQDFGVLVPVAHWEQAQHREGVRYGQVGKS